MGNREARDILVRDPNKMVAIAAVRSPKIQESEIDAISKSKHVCDDVLRQIATTKEWSKLYHIKLNLTNNSKTPIPIVMQFLPHLRELDLRRLAKSKKRFAGGGYAGSTACRDQKRLIIGTHVCRTAGFFGTLLLS